MRHAILTCDDCGAEGLSATGLRRHHDMHAAHAKQIADSILPDAWDMVTAPAAVRGIDESDADLTARVKAMFAGEAKPPACTCKTTIGPSGPVGRTVALGCPVHAGEGET